MEKNDKIILPEEGFVKLNFILRLIPISKSTWYEGVKKGYFLEGTDFGARSKFYPVASVRELMNKIESGTLMETPKKEGEYLMGTSIQGEEDES